jgi:hypothetical protein
MAEYPDYEDTREYDEVKSRGKGSDNKTYPKWIKNREQYKKYLEQGEKND